LKTENLAIKKEKCCHEKYPLLEYDWHNDVLQFEGYINKNLFCGILNLLAVEEIIHGYYTTHLVE